MYTVVRLRPSICTVPSLDHIRCSSRVVVLCHAARVYADEVAVACTRSDHQAMRMERCRRDRLTAVAQKSRVGFPLAHCSPSIDVEDFDLVALGAHCENRGMLVNAKRLQVVLSRLNGLDTLIHTDVPKLDLAVAAARHEFTLTTTLQVHIRNPLFMLLPYLDHGCRRFLALIVHTNRAIAEACNENIAFDLIRGERCDAGARSGGYVLYSIR